jgi:hypothetical protein
MEITAVINKLTRLGMGVVVATASLAMFVASASAQLAPPPAAPKPAAPATTPAAPAAKAPVVAPKTTPAPAKKVASVCKGLDETACKANTECSYVVPVKANKATGKVQAAYCKKSPPPPAAKKAAAPKGSTAGAPAATAPTAPKTTAPVVAPKTPAAGTTPPKPQ